MESREEEGKEWKEKRRKRKERGFGSIQNCKSFSGSNSMIR